MSGFVALAHGGGRPVDERLVAHLADAMAYRGPDGTTIRTAGIAALAHAAFHTSDQPAESPQPLSLDGRVWLVADARLDDRATLIDNLANHGRPVSATDGDAVLLAHAYAAWGEGMIEHLLGDFSFVVWDGKERTLFGARDHIGVKPFYYVRGDAALIVGNTIESLRAHPDVSDDLDDYAIADYLMFGLNRHPQRTSFADIKRLPAAHTLHWRPSGELQIRRFWRLSVGAPVNYKTDREYVEHFDELFVGAVSDRVRGNRAAVLMSGGMDSSSVAAVAVEVMRGRFESFELNACTFVYERLLDDAEIEYSQIVATALGMPIHQLALDDNDADDIWGPSAAWSAEPTEQPASARMIRRVSRAMPGGRVALTGQGGDPAHHVTPADAAHRAAKDGWANTAAAMLRYRAGHGHLPRTGLRTHLKRRLRGHRHEFEPIFPPWMRPELVERLDLRRRFDDLVNKSLDNEATRPEAEHQLGGPDWSFFLESHDAGNTGFLAEYRHPFLDIRLLQFLLALPIVPWLVEKEILRRAMQDRLPATIVERRKAVLPEFPLHKTLLASRSQLKGLSSGNSLLAEFVDVDCFERIASRPEKLREWEYELVTRPLGLALWLRRLRGGAVRTVEKPRESGQGNAAEKALP